MLYPNRHDLSSYPSLQDVEYAGEKRGNRHNVDNERFSGFQQMMIYRCYRQH
jgi:hypothetical protein